MSSHSACMKCRARIDTDIDVYTVLCNRCINAAVDEADDRTRRIEGGDINVSDLTDEERELILAKRAEQRRA